MEPYRPDQLPLDGLDYKRLIGLVGGANAGLAEYNGLLQRINPAIVLSALTSQEAVLSSKIEGIQATMTDVLEHEAGQVHDESKSRDIQEILNYRRALKSAEDHVKDYKIGLNLVCQIHKILMESVRGGSKSPGEFRKKQNWIGPYGCSMEKATFVPPKPLRLLDHLQAWESYLNLEDFDPVAQSGIVHAQFELLHPFGDGNGRTGRLLIPLFLFQKKCLIQPVFYLSEYLEGNRNEYYSRLKGISRDGDWTGWISFYLKAVSVQAKTNIRKTKSIMRLYEETRSGITNATGSKHSAKLLDSLFDRPIFRIREFCDRTKIPHPTMQGIVKKLKDKGLVSVLRPAAGNRPATFVFPELINLVEERRVF